jgi:hypothetical protein
MIWILTLFVTFQGQSAAQPVGAMIAPAACRLAGASMAQAMMQGTPGAVVTFTCTPPSVLS